jgi:hypothetical protein
MRVTRRRFVGSAAGLAGFAGAGRPLMAQARKPANRQQATENPYLGLVKANDEAAAALISESGRNEGRGRIRQVGEALETLAAAFCAPESRFYRADILLSPMEQLSAALRKAQHADGTIDSGNLHSPPDTGFVVETVATALAVLRRNGDPRLSKSEENMAAFLRGAGEALVTGGVHTANHRWVVCSALARINALLPAAKYVDRIDDWLGEGIDIDADGQYSERSAGIYSRVTDNALITVARLLDRPGLLDPVRRNLDLNVYLMHPDGEIETVGSRRQDQFMIGSISDYYLAYRYLAIRDDNALYAAITGFIEQQRLASLERTNRAIHFLEEPLLREALPAGGVIPSDYAKVFPNSGLARIRRGDVSATVYGGSDWPLGVASGLASNPTFFTFRKSKAILQSVRMGAAFFSLGAFHSAGLEANGNRYSLHQRFHVPYYQPLPKAQRSARGDYPLTPAADKRFWNKMNFPNRPPSNVQTLEQRVTITENHGVCELNFDISGQTGVPVTIELSFRTGGKLSGSLQELPREKCFLLKQGFGNYRVGDDAIEFGPGQAEHQFLNLSGHSYIAHGGALKAGGECVYITGFTPFQKVITIRGASA